MRLPARLRDALADAFAVPPQLVDAVRIVPHARFARLHGPGVVATTRPGAIYLAGSAEHFMGEVELVLHEYFHVLRQWDTGALTIRRYALESLRRGYRANRFEVEARAFASRHAARVAARLHAAR